jgi:hypothetical protein
VDGCYHCTAILLPDATVLSAGGAEFDIGDHTPNPPKDTHRNAQIFRPPYLFGGARPEITSVPKTVAYGETYEIDSAATLPTYQNGITTSGRVFTEAALSCTWAALSFISSVRSLTARSGSRPK